MSTSLPAAIRQEIVDKAARTSGTAPELDAIATEYGLLFSEVVEILKAAAPGSRPVPAPRPPSPGGPATRVSIPSTPSPAPAQESLTKPDEIRVLLNTGKAHPSKRIQNAANKVFDDLDKLRALISEDEEKHAARRKAEEERAAARAEVERLEKRLAAAKAKLRPAATKMTTDGPPASDIRAWARENNVDCPATGRVPGPVRDAYLAAHQDQAVAS